MGEMRILTVRQPWAEAIIVGGKNVENRVRNIAGAYRGPIAIHAGLRIPSWDEAEAFQRSFPEAVDRILGARPGVTRVYGVIIGVVDLTDVHSASVIGGCGLLRHDCPEHGTCREHCSPWAQGPSPDGGWFQHLVLENPRPLANPIPFRGALGLRTLDDGTRIRVESELS